MNTKVTEQILVTKSVKHKNLNSGVAQKMVFPNRRAARPICTKKYIKNFKNSQKYIFPIFHM